MPMMEAGMKSRPFGHFNSIMNRPKTKTTKPLTTVQKAAKKLPQNPMLDGMKHAGGAGGLIDPLREEGHYGIRGRDNRDVGTYNRMTEGGGDTTVGIEDAQTGLSPLQPEPGIGTVGTGGEMLAEPQREGLEATIGGGFGEDTAPEWGTTDFQKKAYGLAREQISGQTEADVDYMRSELGGRGFRAGESGIANKAIMGLRRAGAERLGQQSRGLAMQGMQARYGQQQDMMNMLMRMYGMQGQQQEAAFDPYREQVLRGTNV